jgi:hypothetical protein
MSKAIYKIILVFGFIALAHSAYSAVQCEKKRVVFSSEIEISIIFISVRTYLRISEQEFTTLPLDVSKMSVPSEISRLQVH